MAECAMRKQPAEAAGNIISLAAFCVQHIAGVLNIGIAGVENVVAFGESGIHSFAFYPYIGYPQKIPKGGTEAYFAVIFLIHFTSISAAQFHPDMDGVGEIAGTGNDIFFRRVLGVVEGVENGLIEEVELVHAPEAAGKSHAAILIELMNRARPDDVEVGRHHTDLSIVGVAEHIVGLTIANGYHQAIAGIEGTYIIVDIERTADNTYGLGLPAFGNVCGVEVNAIDTRPVAIGNCKIVLRECN